MGAGREAHLHASQGIHSLHLGRDFDGRGLPRGPAMLCIPCPVAVLGEEQVGVDQHIILGAVLSCGCTEQMQHDALLLGQSVRNKQLQVL